MQSLQWRRPHLMVLAASTPLAMMGPSAMLTAWAVVVEVKTHLSTLLAVQILSEISETETGKWVLTTVVVVALWILARLAAPEADGRLAYVNAVMLLVTTDGMMAL